MFNYGAEVAIGGDNYIKWPTEGEKVALIDGDLIPYIVGYTVHPMKVTKAEVMVQIGSAPDIRSTPYFLDAADHASWIINTWVRGAGCDSAKIFMTDSPKNYRIGVAFSKPYKGQRKSEKPAFFYELREYLLEKHGAILSNGEEADDLICIEMHKDFLKLKEQGVVLGSPEHKAFAGCVCCTQDKDLRMIAGWHYQPKTNHHAEGVFFVDEIGWLEPKWKQRETKTKGVVDYIDKLKGAGLKFFYAQILMGDSADNYGGLKGCGATDAFRLIDPCKTEKEMYYAVLNAYKEKYGDGEYVKNYRGGVAFCTPYQLMLEQGRLAYMQRTVGDVWRGQHYCPHGEEDVWK